MTKQSDCAPIEDSDQPWHPPRLIRVLAWASAQSDQSLCCALNGKVRTQAFFMRTAKTLIRLGGCPGWSESSLGAHSFCYFCHVAAQIVFRWYETYYTQSWLNSRKQLLLCNPEWYFFHIDKTQFNILFLISLFQQFWLRKWKKTSKNMLNLQAQ